MSYRKLLVPPSCGVALQDLFHCVRYFEVIIETPFDFTPQRCNTTVVPIAYRADNCLANVGGHLGGKMEHQSRFHIGGRMALLMLRCLSFENFVCLLLRCHWGLISFCLWRFFHRHLLSLRHCLSSNHPNLFCACVENIFCWSRFLKVVFFNKEPTFSPKGINKKTQHKQCQTPNAKKNPLQSEKLQRQNILQIGLHTVENCPPWSGRFEGKSYVLKIWSPLK